MKGQSCAEFEKQRCIGLIGERVVRELYEKDKNWVKVLGRPGIHQRDENGVLPAFLIYDIFRAFYSEVKTKSELFTFKGIRTVPIDVRLLKKYRNFYESSYHPLVIHVYDLETETLYGQYFNKIDGREVHIKDWDKAALAEFDINIFLKEGKEKPCF